MAHSIFLSKLSAEEYKKLSDELWETQNGRCYICGREIDRDVEETNIDHIVPLATGGKDSPSNFALTHAGCNKRKQDGDLRVAQVLEKLRQIQEEVGNRTATLADVLGYFGGSKKDPNIKVDGDVFKVAFGDGMAQTFPIFTDGLSGERSVFIEVPIEYLFHDGLINPRGINTRIGGLIKEFHRGNPQLQVALARLDCGRIKMFDGQHKTAAQLLLGQRKVPLRLFIDPDVQRLIDANTNAGSKLKQVAFDRAIMHQLANTLYGERIERYQREHGLPDDNYSFSEQNLVSYFKGQADLRRYIIDAQKNQITHSTENKLTAYINFDGKRKDLPLSYSAYDKAILSHLIDSKNILDKPLDYRSEEQRNPRQIEQSQIIRFLNILANEIYVEKFDPEIGTNRIENRVSKGDDAAITNDHLAAFRMSKEEILLAAVPLMIDVVTYALTFSGESFDRQSLFMTEFSAPVWEMLEKFVSSYAALPLWRNRALADTIFSGKQTRNYWKEIFSTGCTPDGTRVLEAPLKIIDMIS